MSLKLTDREIWEGEFYRKFATGGGKWKVFTEGMITPEQVYQWVEENIIDKYEERIEEMKE